MVDHMFARPHADMVVFHVDCIDDDSMTTRKRVCDRNQAVADRECCELHRINAAGICGPVSVYRPHALRRASVDGTVG
jgi:hypothetical protein